MVDTLNPQNIINIQQNQDMDLIDILWRQDMDLGVSREVFDPNLRQTLEKEQELALKKQKDLDDFDVKQEPNDDQSQTPPQEDISFVVDGETGELVPMAVPPPQQPELQPVRQRPRPRLPASLDDSDEGLSMEEAMMFLEEQQRRDEQEAAVSIAAVSAPAVTVISPEGEVSEADVSREIEAFIQNAQQMIEQQQQQSVVPERLQEPQQSPVQQAMYTTQSSFEAALDEVASLLDMPSDAPAQPVEIVPGQLMDQNADSAMAPLLETTNGTSDFVDLATGLMDNSTESPLIQNTTMTAYNPEYNVLRQPQTQQATTAENAIAETFSQLTPLANTSLGLPGSDSGIYNFTQDLNMFTNITNLSGSGQLNDTDFQHTHSLLRQLMEDDPLEDLMDTNNTTTALETPHFKQEDTVSTDSAVSSMGSCSPLGDLNEAFSTLSEALEGATGGMGYDGKFEAKYSPYPEQNGCSDFDNLNGGNAMNYSGSPNGSDPSGSSSNLNDMRRYMKHNHTYPLQPGQQPRESKSKLSKEDRRLTNSRDERRAKELKVPFTTEDIINSPVERFNEMLQKYHLTEPQLQLIRDIRRRGKNKVAAQNCRKRKIEALSTIDEDIEDLKKHRDKLVNERSVIDKELKDFKDKMSQLYSEVFASLRDDEGRPYDPSQYSLQQTADGSIILVPRNTTSAATGDSSDEKTTAASRRRRGKKN